VRLGPIAATPTMPILADGLFTTLTAAQGEAVQQIQLPAGYECTNCVVQVLEFMSNHAAPCFYYHCAAVTILEQRASAGCRHGDESRCRHR
jgi:hypothetical protein